VDLGFAPTEDHFRWSETESPSSVPFPFPLPPLFPFPLFPLFPFSPFPLSPFPPFPLSPFPFPRLFSFLDAFALNPATFVTKSRIFPCLVTQFLLLRSGNFGDL